MNLVEMIKEKTRFTEVLAETDVEIVGHHQRREKFIEELANTIKQEVGRKTVVL